MKNKKGFTLIELLAVIIILGILMIIAIPSVTNYISNSRKSAYVDTAKEIVSGARNLVNEGKLEMFDTNTTYYISTRCVKTENANKSPYGEFDTAYVLVTYNGDGYNYYWVSVDETGIGVKEPINIEILEEKDIKSDIPSNYIKEDKPQEGKTTIKVLYSDNCSSFVEKRSAAKEIYANASKTGQLAIVDEINKIYVFKGPQPGNYVKFNCDESRTNCEIWRIIGIYDDKIKIQRTTPILSKHYNDIQTNGNAWDGCTLEQYLNQETQGGYYYTLKQSAKDMITPGIWYVGAVRKNDNAIEAYSHAITTSVTKKVGLLATYEFLYASNGDNCTTKTGVYHSSSGFNVMCGTAEHDWARINAWSLNPDLTSVYNSMRFSGGYVQEYIMGNSLSAYPVVFLKSTIEIVSGDGVSADTAYVLQ